ncbi:MAG: electron transport complex subunit RsxC [Massilibacteroides sp.]|nr:electron transport complex subunit RsxC [Massilibacteroides sp.]
MIKTFRMGGVHPPGNKLSAGKKIEKLAIPSQVVIPLGQHIGAPAQVQVNRGDKVKVGTLLAKAGGFVSANIHSSVSGTVKKVDQIIDASGYRKPAVYIDVEEDEWEACIDTSDTLIKECKLTPKEIITKIAEAGVVGMGGATFPTHVKLTPPPGTKAEMLIINGVECEPFLTADHALMLEKAQEILVGIQLLMKALVVDKAAIGIEKNKPDAIQLLKELTAKEYPMIKVVPLKMKYPQGGEKQLIDAIMKRQVKSGALPISVGAVVQNVGTVFAVYEAVQKNKPLFERVVSVTGKSLAEPSNFMVRIGTPVSALIEAAGGVPEDTGKLISGGPMMGKALINVEVPVAKGTSGVLLLSQKDSLRNPMRDCIRCGKCVSICPMGLNPSLLMNLSANKEWDEAEENYIQDCLECGSCSFTCPANRPLLDYLRVGKRIVMNNMRARKTTK